MRGARLMPTNNYWCAKCTDFADHQTPYHTGPQCNGICMYASELIDHAPAGLVAYPHPECELHGAYPRCHRGECGPRDDHDPECPWPDTLAGHIAAIEAEAKKIGVSFTADIQRIRDRTLKEFRRIWKATSR